MQQPAPIQHHQLLLTLWHKANDGKAFVEAAKQAGYVVSKWPHRRPFRIITPDGQNLDLVSQLKSQEAHGQKVNDERKSLTVTREEVKARLRSVWPQLPTIHKV